MIRSPVLFNYGILLAMGAGWGFTVPLSRIAVSSGYGEYGLVFWQLVIGAALVLAWVFLVQPRRQDPLAPGASIGDSGNKASGPSSWRA